MLADDCPPDGAGHESAAQHAADPGTVAEALRLAGAGLDYLNSPAVAGLDGQRLRRGTGGAGRDPGEAGGGARRVPAPVRRGERARRRRVRLLLGLAGREGQDVEAGRASRGPADAPAGRAAAPGTRPRSGRDHRVLGRSASPSGRAGSRRSCGPRPTRSCSRRPPRARRLMTWRRSPPPRSSSGGPSRPTPMTTGWTSRTATCASAPPSAAPASSAVTSPPSARPRSPRSLRHSGSGGGPRTTAPRASGSTTRWPRPATCCSAPGWSPAGPGADTQVIVHVPIGQLRQMPGAPELEDAWLRARLGEPGGGPGPPACPGRTPRSPPATR